MKKLLLLLLLASCTPKAKKDDSMNQYRKDSAKIEEHFNNVKELMDAGMTEAQAESTLSKADSMADADFQKLSK